MLPYCFSAASSRSAEDQTRLFVDPSSRSSPANGAQPSFTETGAKPRRPVPSPVSESPIRLPPSDLDGSSSVERKPPKPGVELSAGGEREDIKLPVEEKGFGAQTTITSAVAGRPEAVGWRGRNGGHWALMVPQENSKGISAGRSREGCRKLRVLLNLQPFL